MFRSIAVIVFGNAVGKELQVESEISREIRGNSKQIRRQGAQGRLHQTVVAGNNELVHKAISKGSAICRLEEDETDGQRINIGRIMEKLED